MEEQLDTLSQSDPRVQVPVSESLLSLEGATRALIVQAWIYHRESRESHHVVSQVALAPDEIPRIDVPKWPFKRLGSDSAWTAYFESTLIDSKQALRWYDGLVTTGQWAPSWRSSQLSNPVPLSSVLSEPRWPSVLTRKGGVPIPSVQKLEYSMRWHHVLVENPTIEHSLSPKERKLLIAALEEHFGIVITKAPELWQSCHWFQPLPILRYVSTRLDSSEKTGDRGVLVDVVPRRGASLDGIEIFIEEHRATGRRLLSRFRPQPNFFFYHVPLEEDVAQISVRVFHDNHGLLIKEGPHAFLRGVNIQMGLITRERRVQVPARPGRPAQLMRIPVSSGEPMKIGRSETDRSAHGLLHSLKYRLKATAVPEDKQRWFNGDADAAERAVQKMLAGAKRLAIVVDPYFSASEVRPWLPSIADGDAEVQVLTSSAGLRQRPTAPAYTSDKERELAHLEALESELQTLATERAINPTTVRVMSGKTAEIHDRFLVVDERAWLLGSSLNAFGTRGTMLVELPLPSAVITEITNVWSSAVPLNTAIAKLQATKAASQ